MIFFKKKIKKNKEESAVFESMKKASPEFLSFFICSKTVKNLHYKCCNFFNGQYLTSFFLFFIKYLKLNLDY
jgi:hypothetical protein